MSMFDFFNKKKKYIFSESIKKRIDNEIKIISEKKSEGIHVKSKELERDYIINIIIDKRMVPLDIDSEKNNKIPDFILFLLLIDPSYPERPPKLLTKSNFITPSLMDGRDLISEVLIAEWSDKCTLVDITKGLPLFLTRAINAKGYKFYGTFHIGSEYDLRNFDHMLVSGFPCSVQSFDSDKSKIQYCLDQNRSYYLILSGDAMILFEKKETGNGTLVFWSSLFGINELQMNKKDRRVSFICYDHENNNEFSLKLEIDNILLFRDTLMKKMSRLMVKSETTKMIEGKKQEKRLTEKDINAMNITEIEMNVGVIKEKIDKGEINIYTVNIFTTLCGKAIENHSKIANGQHMKYLEMMQEILKNPQVSKMIVDTQEELEKALEKSKDD